MTTILHFKRHTPVENDLAPPGAVDVREASWPEDHSTEVLDSRSFENLKQFALTFGFGLVDGDLEADTKRNAEAAAAAQA